MRLSKVWSKLIEITWENDSTSPSRSHLYWLSSCHGKFVSFGEIKRTSNSWFWRSTPSVLDLENTLGGDPGPGLGADSDFDKRQLEKVRRSWLFKILASVVQWICISSLLPGGLRQSSSGPESFCPGTCPRSWWLWLWRRQRRRQFWKFISEWGLQKQRL